MSNKPTTLEAIQKLWSDDEANDYETIIKELAKLRPKGGGTYAGILIVYDADGLPSIGKDGEYIAHFKLGSPNGKAFPSDANGPPILIKRKDLAVLRHIQVAKPLGLRHAVAQEPMRNHENPIEKYEQSLGRSIRKSKVETQEAFVERVSRFVAERQTAERLVERVARALAADDGFTVENHAANYQKQSSPLSQPLRHGLSFTFEGVVYDLHIADTRPTKPD